MKKLSSLFLVLFLTGCASQPASVSASPETPGPVYAFLDTIEAGEDLIVPFNTTVKLEAESEEDLQVLEPVFQQTLLHCSMLFDRYHAYDGVNNMYTVNASYGTEEPVILEPELYELLKEGITLTRLSEGRFNISIGALYDVWKDRFSPFPVEAEDPDPAEIERALACTVSPGDIEKIVELNDEDHSIIFHTLNGCEDRVILDVGGIAKGYAADLCRAALQPHQLPFLLNMGTSSIVASAEDTKTWYIGVRDPYARVYTIYDYAMPGTGVFTSSGDDSSYFIKQTDDGTLIRHHILNPATGYPENHLKTAAVTGELDAMTADALSTALFNTADDAEIDTLIRAFETYSGGSIDWAVFRETGEKAGVLTTTPGFRERIIESSISEHIKTIEVIK